MVKNKRLLLFSIISVSVLLILSGCSNAGISLSLSPNPVVFSESQLEQNIELTITTEGMGSLSLTNLIVEIIDENGEVVFDDEKAIDVSSPIIAGISRTVDYTLDLERIFNPADYAIYDSFSQLYDGLLKGETHTLRLTVTGSNDSSLTVQIKYE